MTPKWMRSRLRCEDTYVIGLAHDVASKVQGTNLLHGVKEAAHVADVEKVTAWQLVTHKADTNSVAQTRTHTLFDPTLQMPQASGD